MTKKNKIQPDFAGGGYPGIANPAAQYVPAPYMTELLNRIVGKKLKAAGIQGIDEANRFLQEKIVGHPIPELMRELNDDPVEKAQVLAFRALGAATEFEANRLARQALELDPDCVDALYIQAVNSVKSIEKKIERLSAIIKKVEDKWGPEFLAETEGRFWGDFITRPYMRVREQLVVLLHYQGSLPEAADACRVMLRLNPNDNQGIREILLATLLEMHDHAEALELTESYDRDCCAIFEYGRALAHFQAGNFAAAKKALKRAIRANRHVYDHLSHRVQLPDDEPEYYGLGDENEAIVCVDTLGEAIMATPEFLQWISLQ